jgi:hypothetical protein
LPLLGGYFPPKNKTRYDTILVWDLVSNNMEILVMEDRMLCVVMNLLLE